MPTTVQAPRQHAAKFVKKHSLDDSMLKHVETLVTSVQNELNSRHEEELLEARAAGRREALASMEQAKAKSEVEKATVQ